MAGRKINGWLKGALEYGPVLVFLIGFYRLKDQTLPIGGVEYSGFLVMTALFIPLLLICTGVLWALTGHLSKMQIATVVIVVIFGGLSVWLRDERFFKMKPTMIYLLFGGILGIGLLRGQSYLRVVMEEALPMQPAGWMILTRRVTAFFFVLALANELVWRNFSDQTWVLFKTFGLTAALIGFFLTQARLFETYGVTETKDHDSAG